MFHLNPVTFLLGRNEVQMICNTNNNWQTYWLSYDNINASSAGQIAMVKAVWHSRFYPVTYGLRVNFGKITENTLWYFLRVIFIQFDSWKPYLVSNT